MTRPAAATVTVLRNRRLSERYYAMTLGPHPRAHACRPGSFVHVRLCHSDIFLRRPMSVAAVDPERQQVEIIFKVFGRGTTFLSRCRRGTPLDLLGPLGTAFAWPRRSERVLMIGGGVGFPPLLFLATQLVQRGFPPDRIEFFYGGRSADEIVERTRIRKLGIGFHPATDDGSLGEKGMVTEVAERFVRRLRGGKLRLYGCGPAGMLRATDELGRRHGIPGQLALEAHMPCGIGVCLGCVVPLRQGGHARVCVEGPVFDIGEVVL